MQSTVINIIMSLQNIPRFDKPSLHSKSHRKKLPNINYRSAVTA